MVIKGDSIALFSFCVPGRVCKLAGIGYHASRVMDLAGRQGILGLYIIRVFHYMWGTLFTTLMHTLTGLCRVSVCAVSVWLVGCATTDYTTHYGFFEAENSAGELRQFRLYWQTVRVEGRRVVVLIVKERAFTFVPKADRILIGEACRWRTKLTAGASLIARAPRTFFRWRGMCFYTCIVGRFERRCRTATRC